MQVFGKKFNVVFNKSCVLTILSAKCILSAVQKLMLTYLLAHTDAFGILKTTDGVGSGLTQKEQAP